MGLFFIFLIGICLGSFLNVLIDRIPRGESVIKGKSYCESCKKPLGGLDLIPIVSFLFLKGRCRYCHSPFSFYYPIVELITGFLFVFTTSFILNNFQFLIFNFQSNQNFQLSIILILTLVYYLLIVSSFIVVFFTDLKYGIIPDKIVFPAIIASLIFNFQFSIFNQIQNSNYSIFNFLLSGVGAFLFFFSLFLITKGKGMGLGDVKLAFLLGLFLGFPKIVVAFYAAFLTGALVSLILVMFGKKNLRKDTVAFGPFLVIGAFTALFWGEKIIINLLPFLLRR